MDLSQRGENNEQAGVAMSIPWKPKRNVTQPVYIPMPIGRAATFLSESFLKIPLLKPRKIMVLTSFLLFFCLSLVYANSESAMTCLPGQASSCLSFASSYNANIAAGKTPDGKGGWAPAKTFTSPLPFITL
jgi:hypothetical protein